MATKKRFSIVLEKDPGSEVTSITIPFDVKEAFGTRARVPVRGTINGFSFRSSIFPMGGGQHYMVVNKEMRAGAGVSGGDTITVMMERDDEPRTITVPDDFARALKKNKTALSAWEKLSYSHHKEYVKAIEEAKKPETRQRRVDKAIEQLAGR
jgi:uncharacterized protein DUF1905/bacteriocin resistance YdeI/OmpD-like protein